MPLEDISNDIIHKSNMTSVS